MANEGVELLVYRYNGDLKGDPVEILNSAVDPKYLEELKGIGAGSFKIFADDPKIVNDPTLLDYRNVIKVRVDNVVVGAFIIRDNTTTLIDSGERSAKGYEISGPGLKDWADDAQVQPYGGLQAWSHSDRFFNFASEVGTWFHPDQWTPAVASVHVKEYSPFGYWGPTVPDKWPDIALGAQWIWDRAHELNHPNGDVYFRKNFTVDAEGTYRLYVAADDYYDVYIDGERLIVSDPAKTAFLTTGTVDFTLAAGGHVIACHAQNIFSGPGGLLLALTKTDGENPEVLVLETDGNSGWVAMGYPAQPPGWTIGEVFLSLINEAKTRGILSMQNLVPTFTATNDSAGQPWPPGLEYSFKVTDPYSSVISKLEELNCDVWIDAATLQLNIVSQRGIDRSGTSGNAEAIAFIEGRNLRKAQSQGVGKIKNNLAVLTDSGWMIVDESSSQSKYGRLEGKLETNASPAVSQSLADIVFSQRATAEEGATYDIYPTVDETPWVKFFVGDWVLAPNNQNILVPRRVMSISVERGASGRPLYTVEFDTIFRDIEDKFARYMNKSTGGAVGGSMNNTAAVGGSGGFGGPVVVSDNTPPPAVVVLPAAPTGLNGVSAGNWSSNGMQPISQVTLTWDAVTELTDGTQIVPTGYEVWASNDDGASYTPWGRVGTTTITMQPFIPGTTWLFKVATLLIDRMSEFTVPISQTMVGPTAPMAAPTAPTVTSSKGVLIVHWDGQLTNGAPPPQFRNVYVSVSTAQNGTYIRMGAALSKDGRDALISGLIVGTTYWVHLTAVDGVGIESPASTSVSHVLAGIDVGDLDAAVQAAIDSANAAATAAQDIADEAFTLATQAADDADDALVIANGKNRIIFSTSPASGTGYTVGDIWFQKNAANVIIGQWEFTTTWIPKTIDNAVIANLDAVKITAGILDAARIGARTITADKIVITDINNYIADPDFTYGNAQWALPSGASVVTISDPPPGSDATKALQVTANGSILNTQTSTAIPVRPGEKYYAEMWIRRMGPTGDTTGTIQLTSTVTRPVANGGNTSQLFMQVTPDLITTTWQLMSGIVTIPDFGMTLQVRPSVLQDVADGVFQITEVILRRMMDGQLIVDGSITSTEIAAGAITAGKIAAGSVTAAELAAGSVVAGKVAAGSITSNEIAARSIVGDNIAAGTVTVSHLAAGVGGQLDISANAAVNILVGQVSSAQADADAVNADLQAMQTYYSFGSTGAIVSTPSSPFSLALRSDKIEMMENGNVVSYWNSGQMYVTSMVVEQVVLGNHKIEKYGTGTVVMAL